jgi:hypothetical protein
MNLGPDYVQKQEDCAGEGQKEIAALLPSSAVHHNVLGSYQAVLWQQQPK